MNPEKVRKAPVFEPLKRLFSAIFGVNETLFLAGFGGLFYGLQGLWSIYGAFIVCGSLLIAIAIGGILFSQKQVE